MQKYAIFGAGADGKRAVNEIGKDNVICFIDNDQSKQNTLVENIIVLSLDEFINKFRDATIIIATKAFPMIIPQLEIEKLNYIVWTPLYNWFGTKDVLVQNPYIHRKMQFTDEEAIPKRDESAIDFMAACTEVLANQKPLFNHIEIETYNRCNGGCEFCPVNVKNDTRVEKLMPKSLFFKIIDELSKIDYHGCLSLFSNNEPFLDKRMIEFCKYVRQSVPHAKTHLYTNGTLLTLDMFIEVIEYLDELIIDNYNTELVLIPNNLAIKDYCEQHPELKEKVTIVLRNPKEVLEARGGEAPNKKKRELFLDVKCTHPFRQMIIRPDGKVSICCNDALGFTDMGDVSKDSLVNIWWGEQFKEVREKINAGGRGKVEFCRYCDSMILV